MVRCKFYCGSDAGKYIPYVRAVGGSSYCLPARINGTACTAENAASLLLSDEWNVLEWEKSQWNENFTNPISMRPWCKIDGSEFSGEAGRIAYYDDIEVLL